MYIYIYIYIYIDVRHFPGPGKFWNGEDFQNSFGKVLDFYLEKIIKISVNECSLVLC